MTVSARLRLDGRRLLVAPGRGTFGAAVARLAGELGASLATAPPCDILVAVAELAQFPSFLELAPDSWDAAVREHLDGFYERCRECVPAMAKAADGVVVAIVCGTALGLEEAVIGLTKALARELAELGVRANAVRAGDAAPEAVAELALYLASPAAGYVTGTTLVAQVERK
jgi:NAD(P)-dependent dehydrogenase (short-subunit alcohol dehydrogenase family)